MTNSADRFMENVRRLMIKKGVEDNANRYYSFRFGDADEYELTVEGRIDGFSIGLYKGQELILPEKLIFIEQVIDEPGMSMEQFNVGMAAFERRFMGKDA